MSSAGYPAGHSSDHVCGCVGSMMPESCPDCGGHPRQTLACTTCGAQGVIFKACQTCTTPAGSVNNAQGGSG